MMESAQPFRVETLERIIDSLANPVFIKNANHQFIMVNRAFCEFLDVTADQMIGKSDHDFFPESEVQVFHAMDDATLKSLSSTISNEAITLASGETRWIQTRKSAFVDPRHGPVLCGVISDLTELKAAREQLEHSNEALQAKVAQRTVSLELLNQKLEKLAFFDVLTQLPNRANFELEIATTLNRAEQESRQFALIYMDIDDLKSVNDSYGHPVGDLFIRQVAQRASEVIEDNAFMARIGGDEFMVLIRFDHLKEVINQADRLVARFSEPLEFENRLMNITASMGIALYPENGTDVTTLVKHADSAMYQTKDHNKGHYTFYRQEFSLRARRRLDIETALRRALHENLLIAWYQPIMSGDGQQIAGYESLARLQPTDLAEIPAIEFIRVAEQTGMIHQLGDQILRQACAFIASHCHNGEFVTVNISGTQLSEARFAATLRQVVGDSGIDAGQLVMEITESVMATMGEEIRSLKLALKDMGIRLWIDDFGTGYSNLAQLKRMEFDALKIDKGFIRDLPDSDIDESLIRTIITLAAEFNLKVVAEGIETERQAACLEALGVDFQQGFLFGKPREPLNQS